MSQNGLPPSNAVVPVQQMQIDSSFRATQAMAQMAKMMESSVLPIPASSLQTNNAAVFGQMHAHVPPVEAVNLQNVQMANMSVSVLGGLVEVTDLFGRDSDNYNNAVRHRNDASKDCKQAEIKYLAEAQQQMAQVQMHRDDLAADVEKNRQAAVKELTTYGMNHRQQMFGTLCNHLQAMSQIDFKKLQENNYHERRLKRLQPKKNRRGGRARIRGRSPPRSQPIVEEVEDSGGA